MSNALIPVDELKQLAGMLAKSSLLPPDLRGKEADIAVTVMAGRELGLAPMAALRSIYVVKGKPVLSADAMVGLVLSSGVAEYFTCVETTNTVATYETKRKGSPAAQRLSFTIEQARRAHLTGGNWQTYPEAMLRARAKAALARDVYPDALAGCYTEDEVDVLQERSRPVAARPQDDGVIDAEIVEKPATALPAPPPSVQLSDDEVKKALLRQTIEDRSKPNPLRDMIIRITAARTEADLKALEPELKALPEELKTKARQHYRVQKKGIADGTVKPAPDAMAEPLPDWMATESEREKAAAEFEATNPPA